MTKKQETIILLAGRIYTRLYWRDIDAAISQAEYIVNKVLERNPEK